MTFRLFSTYKTYRYELNEVKYIRITLEVVTFYSIAILIE